MARWFNMPPAHQDPAVERNNDLSIYKVLRDAVAFLAAIRAETRLLRRELQQLREEVKMSFEELSANVQALIEEATKDITAAVAAAVAAGTGGPSEASLTALSDKVKTATQTLKDTFATLPTTPPAGTVVVTDPVTGTPTTVDTGSPNAPGDTVVIPPVDPNAPVQ
jgi:hypothetical protein